MQVKWRVYDKCDGQAEEDCFSDSDGTVKDYVTDVPDDELDDCVNDLERNELINMYVQADYDEWIDFVWTKDSFDEEVEDEDPVVA
jgi:hypothetical protein